MGYGHPLLLAPHSAASLRSRSLPFMGYAGTTTHVPTYCPRGVHSPATASRPQMQPRVLLMRDRATKPHRRDAGLVQEGPHLQPMQNDESVVLAKEIPPAEIK